MDTGVVIEVWRRRFFYLGILLHTEQGSLELILSLLGARRGSRTIDDALETPRSFYRMGISILDFFYILKLVFYAITLSTATAVILMPAFKIM